MLTLDSVSKQYETSDHKALDQVSFSLQSGEFVALLGPNGAGKTTIINTLAGNVKKDTGRIVIGDFDLDHNELETKRLIGIVPQELVYEMAFTVNETLLNQSGYFGIRHNQDYIDWLLQELSLFDKKDARSHDLSGGMKRRLLIAKALIHRPKLLILDEPTAGVDIDLRYSLYDFLNQLNQNGTTIILTTHYLEEAEKLCDRIIMISQGKIVADNSKKSLLENSTKESLVEIDFDNQIQLSEFDFLADYSPSRPTTNKLTLKVINGDITTVLSKLSQNNKTFSHISMQKPRLEDVFFQHLQP